MPYNDCFIIPEKNYGSVSGDIVKLLKKANDCSGNLLFLSVFRDSEDDQNYCVVTCMNEDRFTEYGLSEPRGTYSEEDITSSKFCSTLLHDYASYTQDSRVFEHIVRYEGNTFCVRSINGMWAA